MKTYIGRLVAILMACMALTACNSNDPDSYDITGVWYYGVINSDTDYDFTQVDLARDHSFTSTQSIMHPGDTREQLVNTMGIWSLDGDNITLSYAGLGSDTYVCKKINDSDHTMTLDLRGTQVKWYRNAAGLRR